LTVFAATGAAARPDGYYGPDGPFGLRGQTGPARRSKRAQDATAAARLWDESVRLTGVSWAVTRVR
jgi:hypothetical protein